METILVESYDNKIVRIPRERLEEFRKNQAKIKRLLEEGNAPEKVLELLKNDK